MIIDLYSHFFPVEALQNLGGGLLAFNIWRLDHCYGLRPELKNVIPHKPSHYLRKLYFDSIVHSVSALQYLSAVVGADRVVIGTDYPMAMGDFAAVGKLRQVDVTDAEREMMLGDNAARALGL
jgi:aminocarboxymuconate-semialdehyde decarboxylase